MKENWKLPSLALAVTLLSTSSAFALERAAPVQMAQAGPDEKGGGEGGAREPRGKAGEENGAGERPAKPQRKDAEPGPKKAPAAGSGEGPPQNPQQKKPRPPKEERQEPAAKAPPVEKRQAPPVEKKAEPPVEKKIAPEQIKPAQPKEPEPKAQPKAEKLPLPKAEPEKEPAPKAKEPAPKAEPKGPPLVPKGAGPGAAPEGKPNLPDAKPGAEKKAPAPASKGPEGDTPKKGVEGAPPAREGGPPAKDDPRVKDGKQPATAAPAGAAGPVAAPSEAKDLKELKQERKERTEDGGKRVIIEEPDKRAIIKEGGKTIIRHDETERFNRLDRGNSRHEKRNGLDISISIRPGGIEIYTETDDRGRSLRRYRRDRDGREVVLFDNRDYYRRHNDGSFADAIVDLPPPRLAISSREYIVDYEEASDVEIYETLSAPPVEELDRTYSMEEVRRSPMLRDRMRRIDLDAISFEFGAWEVTQDQYPALQRVADAMRRVIDRNPDEMFLIEGHTDAVGSDEDNLSLSDRRAESVSIILTEQFGVPPENMSTQGYGEQYLKVNTEQPERQNRRVAVRRITPLLSRSEK